MARLDWRHALAWRLRRHHLDRRAPRSDALDVVARIGGLHAQLASSAELSLWARVEALERDAVERALWQERSLVKTWAMRGTLHLLPAAEYPLWQATRSTDRREERPAWLRYFGVTREQMQQLVASVGTALDGKLLTRSELADEVARLTGAPALGEALRESWGTLLKPAANRGALCFAPSAGQSVRFTQPASWLGPWEPVVVETALAAVTRRYLGAYAPATRDDFARWWGTTPVIAGKMIAALGEEAVEVDVEGARHWMLAADVEEATAATDGSVRLLPAFDPWVAGASRETTALFAGPVQGRIYRPQGWLSPVLLVDGRMDGAWRHERKGGRLRVEIEPFVPPPAAVRRAAEGEAERLAGFLGGDLSVTWRT